MTRILGVRFRRLIVVAAMSAGALGLAVGLAGTASAATTGNTPTPAASTPCPCSTPTPAPRHHKPPPPPPVTHCFTSLEVEHDTLAGQPVGDQQYGRNHQASIEVVQLVQVCVTEQRGHPDKVKVCDETGPFAWEVPAYGPAPTPSGLPDSIVPLLAA